MKVIKEKEYCTYLWKDPKTGVARYAGEGEYPDRPFDHFSKFCTSKLGNMLRKRVREGYDPQPIIIRAYSKKHAEEMEIFLIAEYGREDLGTGTLFNLTDGGGCGIPGYKHTDETRKIISEKCSVISTAMWASPEHRVKQQAGMEEYWQKPGMKELNGVRSRAAWDKPGARERKSAANLVFYEQNPDAGPEHSRKMKLHYQNNPDAGPEHSQTMVAHYEKPGSREITGAASKEVWARPGFKEVMTAKHCKPCTIDGKTIYPSKKALVAALGCGAQGFQSPTFRYVEKDTLKTPGR